MNRPFPAHYQFFLDFANQHKLTLPRGRALYMCNRKQNGDWYGADREDCLNFAQRTSDELLARLKSIQPSTAQRWFEHWNSGGAIKMISLDRESYNARRRERDAARKIQQVGFHRRSLLFDKLLNGCKAIAGAKDGETPATAVVNAVDTTVYQEVLTRTNKIATIDELSRMTNDLFRLFLEGVK